MLYSHLKLHLIVIIFGFTAILGKLITMPAEQLVWWRMLIAALTFIALFSINRTTFILPLREVLKILGVGLIVAGHWLCFFGAIKLSNVSVMLGCLASATLFTSLLEPVVFRKRMNGVEVIIGLLIIAGLYLIFQFETHYWKGIVTAITSAFLAGLFTVLNRKLVAKHRARIITFWEMIGGVLGISIYLIFSGGFSAEMFHPKRMDMVYLLILGTICTAFAFVVQVDIMKKLTAYVVVLTINLEPVYGIFLAFLFFGQSELMSAGFYSGTMIILASVFGYPVYVKHLERKKAIR
jgi:drug/metabolite transporter (DMT)-like permease